MVDQESAPRPRRQQIYNDDESEDAARKMRDDDSWMQRISNSLAEALRRVIKNG